MRTITGSWASLFFAGWLVVGISACASGGTPGGLGGPDAPGPDPSDEPGACTVAALDCNDDPFDGCEVDGSTHAQHCGACGRNCGGGTCVDGVCQEYAVAPHGEPDDLVVAGDSAYLSYSFVIKLVSQPLTIGAMPTIVDVTNRPKLLAPAGNELVFTTAYEYPDSVMQAPLTGGAGNRIAYSSDTFFALAVAGDRAVWVEEPGADVYHARIDGPLETPVAIPAAAEGLSTNATHAAFREKGAIVLVELATGSRSAIAQGGAVVSHPTLSNDAVYWVRDGALERWSFADGATTTLTTGLGPIDEIAVTATRIYVSASWAPIRSFDLAGGTPVEGSVFSANVFGNAQGVTWVTLGILYHAADPDPSVPTTPTCDAVFADCNDRTNDGCEASLWSDRNNCGACGRVCDGPCALGKCQPTVLAGDFGASEIAIVGDELVFTEHVGRFAHLPKAGGPITDIPKAEGAYASQFATNGKDLYFAIDDGIFRYTAGTAGVSPVTTHNGPRTLAFDAGTLYFSSKKQVYRVSAAGGTPQLFFDVDAKDQDSVSAIAALSGEVFIATDASDYPGYVMKVPAAGGSAVTLLSEPLGSISEAFTTLAVDGTSVFAGHDYTGLYVVPKAGGTAKPLISPSGAGGVQALAQDATHVYWIAWVYHSDGGWTGYELLRAKKDGSEIETLAELDRDSSALAVDDAYVYFVQPPLLLRLLK